MNVRSWRSVFLIVLLNARLSVFIMLMAAIDSTAHTMDIFKNFFFVFF